MIKHHKVEMIFATDSDIYQTMKKIAARANTSVEAVLELLINNAIMQHIENNSNWAEALTEECIEVYESTNKYFDTVSADDLDYDEIDKLFETVPPGTIFTGTGYIPESGMIVSVYEEEED